MRSPVWNYFDIVTDDETKAICRICQTIVSRGSKYSTSSLLSHLRYKHDLAQKAGEESLAEMERLTQLMDKDFLSNAIRANDPRIQLVARGGNVKSPVWRTFLVILFNGKKTMHIACNLCHQVYRYDSHHMGTSNLYRHKCVHLKLKDGTDAPTTPSPASNENPCCSSGDVGLSNNLSSSQGVGVKEGTRGEDDSNKPDPSGPFSPLMTPTYNAASSALLASRQRQNRNLKRRMNYFNKRALAQLGNGSGDKRPSGLSTNLSLQRAIGQSMLLQQIQALTENGRLNIADPDASLNDCSRSQDESMSSDNPFTYLASLGIDTISDDLENNAQESDGSPLATTSEIYDDNFIDASLSDIDKSFMFWKKITSLGLLSGFITEIKTHLDELQNSMLQKNAFSENNPRYERIVDHARHLSYVVTELKLTPRLKDKLSEHQSTNMVEREVNRLELISLKRKMEVEEMWQEELQRKTLCFDDLIKQQDTLLDDPEKFKDNQKPAAATESRAIDFGQISQPARGEGGSRCGDIYTSDAIKNLFENGENGDILPGENYHQSNSATAEGASSSNSIENCENPALLPQSIQDHCETGFSEDREGFKEDNLQEFPFECATENT